MVVMRWLLLITTSRAQHAFGRLEHRRLRHPSVRGMSWGVYFSILVFLQLWGDLFRRTVYTRESNYFVRSLTTSIPVLQS